VDRSDRMGEPCPTPAIRHSPPGCVRGGACGRLLGDPGQSRRDRANRGHPAHDTRVVARTRRQRERPHRQHRVGRRLPRVRGGRRLHGGQARCARRHTHAPRELWGQPVRVIEISPGLVETELSRVRFGVDEQRAAAVYERVTLLSAAEHSGLPNMGSDAPAACQRRRGRRDGTSAGSGFSDSRSTASSRRLNGW
jgi:hypothetical protein